MEFLQKYKKLDNLCKDSLSSGKGVTAYIESMEKCGRISDEIDGFWDDYKNLKKYRHIRNRIAHENDVDESDLCGRADEKWIENFYGRIIKQKDPLALYKKAAAARSKKEKPKNAADSKAGVSGKKAHIKRKKRRISRTDVALVLCLIILALCIAGAVMMFLHT